MPYSPTVPKFQHRQLKDAARRLLTEYATTHGDDLHRVWETERAFELHLDGVIVQGRADVILDYKTSTDGDLASHERQLQVYADAGYAKDSTSGPPTCTTSSTAREAPSM